MGLSYRTDFAADADDAVVVAVAASRIDGDYVLPDGNRIVKDNLQNVMRRADDSSFRHLHIAFVRPALKPHALVLLGGKSSAYIGGGNGLHRARKVLTSAWERPYIPDEMNFGGGTKVLLRPRKDIRPMPKMKRH